VSHGVIVLNEKSITSLKPSKGGARTRRGAGILSVRNQWGGKRVVKAEERTSQKKLESVNPGSPSKGARNG